MASRGRGVPNGIVDLDERFPPRKSISRPTLRFIIHGNRYDPDINAIREIECHASIILDANAEINLCRSDFRDYLKQHFYTNFRERNLKRGVYIRGIVKDSFVVASSVMTVDLHAIGRALRIPFFQNRKRWSSVQFAVVQNITERILIGAPTQQKHGIFAYDPLMNKARRKWGQDVRVIEAPDVIPPSMEVSANQSREIVQDVQRRRERYKERHDEQNKQERSQEEAGQTNSEAASGTAHNQAEGQQGGAG